MAFLSFLYKYGIWISVPVFVLSVLLLVRCVTSVIKAEKETRLVSLPLLDRQEIDFALEGSVVLCMEGPMLSRRFANLEYELTGPDGRAVRSRPVLFRSSTSGFSKAIMELRVYEIAQPGRHVFEIRGLGDERPSDAEHRMVFTLPHLARSMTYVLGIVFSAMLTIGSLVLFLMRVVGVK
jgi:hypothetical protein